MGEVTERVLGLAAALASSVRSITKLRAEVELLEAGSLPNDGKLIDDQRQFGLQA